MESKNFYEESLLFDWDMMVVNQNYFLELTSISTFQKIDQLYDMLIYFLEKEEYEKCTVISNNIKQLKQMYHDEINHNENKNDRNRKANAKGSKKVSNRKDAI